jgi:hypothetical protein
MFRVFKHAEHLARGFLRIEKARLFPRAAERAASFETTNY